MLLSLQFITLTIKKKIMKINVSNISHAVFSYDSNINVLFILPIFADWVAS